MGQARTILKGSNYYFEILSAQGIKSLASIRKGGKVRLVKE